MDKNCRLPAYPLVVNDPYFSIWSAADEPAQADTTHWSGPVKPIRVKAVVNGKTYRLLGLGEGEALAADSLLVTPMRTVYRYHVGDTQLELMFWSPSLPQDPDLFSVPATFVQFKCVNGSAKLILSADASLTYEGDEKQEVNFYQYRRDNLDMAFIGQTRQKLLGHSGDHVTIDWGYLYLASDGGVCAGDEGLSYETELSADKSCAHAILAYDDVASILYFGTPCKAWYARSGKTLPDVLCEWENQYDELYKKVLTVEDQVLCEARAIGGEDYALIVSAAWRHTLGAHKLIATPAGEMALLSKENDSNGCIGTVDVSYPSSPFFLKYNPQLVNALCRPVLEFASMPIWDFPFAPHDVGRYPIAGGQVYAYRGRRKGHHPLQVFPPFYLYPANAAQETYDFRYQMPLEECGNMIIMLTSAWMKTGDDSLIRKYGKLLTQWVQYLEDFGENPEDQLCTDDFAGHLAQNVNLSAKALVGLACYAKIAELAGDDRGESWQRMTREMAESWAKRTEGDLTPLTFNGDGWSMKYNLAWDKILHLCLLPDDFYEKETQAYTEKMNQYGLPLDSRKTYTKSDWIVWTASLCRENPERFARFIAPLARYLRETDTRVPFSDWYDTVSGAYVHFIARSVQGGMFMPLL